MRSIISCWIIIYLRPMENFEIIAQNIQQRRSTKPAVMNGQIIPDAQIRALLALADWAPTHAMTEPWRFIVYAGDAKKKYAEDLAELYKTTTPEDKFILGNYEKMLHQADTLSHIIVVYMKRGHNPNIPALEEICATAAAVQNILLGASALGIAALWSTGGMTLKPALKDYFQLGAEDQIIGQLYLGYSATTKEGVRSIPLDEKIIWHK